MRFFAPTCEVFARAAYLSAATSPHIVDISLIRYGLHRHSQTLRQRLQEAIDQAEGKGYDAILLVYGLCGKATAGLQARSIPVIIPRAHDCITLFLGSRQRYQHQFENFPGTYWYTQDYVERDDGSGASMSLGSDTAELETVYDEYVQKYGKDNADYLMQVMGAWQQHYQRAVFLEFETTSGEVASTKAQKEASQRGWLFERLQGDPRLIRGLLHGEWQQDPTDYLVLPPNATLEMTAGENIFSVRE